MFTKPLLTLILAACGVSSATTPTTADPPTDRQPPEPIYKEAYFCCDSVNGQGNGSGEGCHEITHSVVGGCAKVLYCSKGCTNDEGSVTCTNG